MKTAIRILVIVGVVIGFIWSNVVYFGSSFLEGCEAALAGLTEEEEFIEEIRERYFPVLAYAVGAFFVNIAALIFGLIASKEKLGKAATIVNGILLFFCGIGMVVLHSWVAGPLFIIGGFLGFLSGLMIKPKQENAGS